MTRHFSNRARERLWDATRGNAQYPICNIPGCGLPVTIGQRWVESHFPIPKWEGGEVTGVAHELCNHAYWCTVEAPARAKSIRIRQKHIGAFRSRRSMPGGRDDYLGRKKKLDGSIDIRQSIRQHLIRMGLIDGEG